MEHEFIWLTPEQWRRNAMWDMKALFTGIPIEKCITIEASPPKTNIFESVHNDKRFLKLYNELPHEIAVLTRVDCQKLLSTPTQIEASDANYPGRPDKYIPSNKRIVPKPSTFFSRAPHISIADHERLLRDAEAEMQDAYIQAAIHNTIALARYRYEWDQEHNRLASVLDIKEKHKKELAAAAERKHEEERRLRQEKNRKKGLLPYLNGNGFIYIGVNLGTQKPYIGQTIRFPEKRWEEHIACETGATSHAVYKVLLDDVHEYDLDRMESFYIGAFNSYRNGHNRTKGEDIKAYELGQKQSINFIPTIREFIEPPQNVQKKKDTSMFSPGKRLG